LQSFEDAYGLQVVRLVQRCERRKLFQLVRYRGRDSHRTAEALPAVYDAMADRDKAVPFAVVRSSSEPVARTQNAQPVLGPTHALLCKIDDLSSIPSSEAWRWREMVRLPRCASQSETGR